MNKSAIGGFCVGVAVTIFGVVLIGRAKPEGRTPETPGNPGAAEEPTRELREEIANLRAENRRLREERTPPPPVEPAKAGPGLDETIGRLVGLANQKGYTAITMTELGEIRKALKDIGPAAMEKLGELLLNGKTPEERGMAAYMIELLNDPAGVPFIDRSLREEKDEMVRRLSSHALAMIRGDSAIPALLQAMRNDADFGVRLNCAYGLAKAGHDEGLQSLVASYDAPEAREYRIAVFGAIADVAHPSTAPMFRKTLGESAEMATLMIAIGAVEKMKDRESLPLLLRIIQGTAPESAKAAARKAYNAITGEEIYK